jgi:hypothetical protein
LSRAWNRPWIEKPKVSRVKLFLTGRRNQTGDAIEVRRDTREGPAAVSERPIHHDFENAKT